ncbi:hypothetical protein B0H13DRAFT_1890415 [Mycena leptocephala]|nr:hypothetical protein B0H13DRAFT_1890415 [Mycena leptocephala]
MPSRAQVRMLVSGGAQSTSQARKVLSWQALSGAGIDSLLVHSMLNLCSSSQDRLPRQCLEAVAVLGRHAVGSDAVSASYVPFQSDHKVMVHTVLGLEERFSFDAANFYESAFFKESDPKSGLGGWGDASTQFHVLDGGFSASSWYLHEFRAMIPLYNVNEVCLSDQITKIQPKPAGTYLSMVFFFVFPVPGLAYDHTHPANASFIKLVVESLTDGFVGDFKDFQVRMEGVEGPLIKVHFIVSGKG